MTAPRVVIASAGIIAALASPAHATDDARYRQALIDVVALRDAAAGDATTPTRSARDPLARVFIDASPAFIDAVARRLPPIDELETRIATLRVQLAAATSPSLPMPPRATRAIEYPEPSPLPACADVTPYQAEVTLGAWSVAAEVLAASKWACLQSEAGENGAAGCTPLSIGHALAKAGFRANLACLEVQRDAVHDAVLDTQRNVAAFLDERADVVASTRASQVSLDAMRRTLDETVTRLADLRVALVAADGATAQGLVAILDRALALSLRLNAIAATTDDTAFRTREIQADVEDLQHRIADAQSLAQRLATDAATLHGTVVTADATLSGTQAGLAQSTLASLQRRLAAALGDPSRPVVRFRLPAAQGGELERSREQLIRAITGFTSLGVDTTAARAQLAIGDTAYDAGRALDAYAAFAAAWRLLFAAPTTVTVVIGRDSFE